MSELIDETLEVLEGLRGYVDDSHTEYSMEDCMARGDMCDRMDELVEQLEELRKEDE